MRVMLEMSAGPRAGERVSCVDDQVFRVGHSATAEFTVSHDDAMSRLHFSVECRGGCAIIRDLDSSNGTYVNGERIQQLVLHAGDEVKAGETTFQVSLQDVPPKDNFAQPNRKRYRVKTVGADRSVFRGEEKQYDLLAVMQQMAAQVPMHIVLNFKRAGLPTDICGDRKDLFDVEQVPAEIRAQDSLVVLSQSNDLDVGQLATEVWGRDAVCVVFSELSEETLTEKIRFLSGWFSRPSILRRQLDSAGDLLNDKLFKETAALLCEGEAAEEWLLYSPDAKQEEWVKLGFASPPQELL